MNDPTTVHLNRAERRTKRMTGLVTLTTWADWETIQAESLQAESPMSVGDLITLAVKLIKNHPNILKKNYELKEKK